MRKRRRTAPTRSRLRWLTLPGVGLPSRYRGICQSSVVGPPVAPGIFGAGVAPGRWAVWGGSSPRIGFDARPGPWRARRWRVRQRRARRPRAGRWRVTCWWAKRWRAGRWWARLWRAGRQQEGRRRVERRVERWVVGGWSGEAAGDQARRGRTEAEGCGSLDRVASSGGAEGAGGWPAAACSAAACPGASPCVAASVTRAVREGEVADTARPTTPTGAVV